MLVRLRVGRLRVPAPAPLAPPPAPSFGLPGRISAAESGGGGGLPTPRLDMWALSVCWILLGTLGAGSAQLKFEKIHSVSYDVCNTTEVIIPCVVTNLQRFSREEIFLKWKVNGKEFYTYDGYENRNYKNDTFLSVDLLDVLNLTAGVASIKMSLKEAIPGNYTCIVVERNREGEHIIELRYGSPFWFPPRESFLVIGAAIMAAVVFLLQVGFVAVKFEMSLLKKISFGIAAVIVIIIVVSGALLLVKEGYTLASQFGLGLVVFPTVILVPPLFFVFQSVFEKPPLFAIILIILKALGYLIAVAGFAASLPECPPKQASVVVAGLGIIDIVAVIAFIYMVVIGTRFKDHQPPKQSEAIWQWTWKQVEKDFC